MHDIEPYHKWREHYTSSEDERSPFYGRIYDEFKFTNKVYNYFIHPQWDEFGSPTLYAKIIYADYHKGVACIELIGEWNDCISNDIMFLKREIIDDMMNHDVHKYVVLCDNVLNFHSSDDSYYEEWYDDVKDENGWIVFLNTLEHVMAEMESVRLQHYVNFGPQYNGINWRKLKPSVIADYIEDIQSNEIKQLSY